MSHPHLYRHAKRGGRSREGLRRAADQLRTLLADPDTTPDALRTAAAAALRAIDAYAPPPSGPTTPPSGEAGPETGAAAT
jgi:hypothetical protein